MYKKNLLINGKETSVTRISDNACIPFDPGNTEYKKYLEWVTEGNTAEEWSAE